MAVKAVSFVAESGTGKITLLEKVLSELKSHGYRVGAIKHDAHRFEIDHPGKDSHRLTAAGKLPQVGCALGKGIRNIKSGLREAAEVATVIVEEKRRDVS